MKNKNLENKNEEIQSRREFFKEAAKKTLPVLGAIMVANIPLKSIANETTDCDYSCSSSCSSTCWGSCQGSCNLSCQGSCAMGCQGSCSMGCQYSCSRGCGSQSYS